MLPNNWLKLTTMSAKDINTILEIAYQDDTTPTHEDVFAHLKWSNLKMFIDLS